MAFLRKLFACHMPDNKFRRDMPNITTVEEEVVTAASGSYPIIEIY